MLRAALPDAFISLMMPLPLSILIMPILLRQRHCHA